MTRGALTDEQAAAVPMAAATAWQALTDTVRLESGQRVLLIGRRHHQQQRTER